LDYWELSIAEHTTEGLPKMFAHELYDHIHEWFGQRPQIQPPHIWDLLAIHNGNHLGIHASHESDDEGSEESHLETENPLSIEVSNSLSQALPTSSQQQPSHPVSRKMQPDLCRGSPSPSRGSPSCTYTSSTLVDMACSPIVGRMPFPPTSTQAPVCISSSDASEFSSKQRPWNSRVQRKSLLSHNVIAEATKASREVMAMQMRNMVEASRDLERSKIDVQLKLFSEQMEYQRKKDRRLYEPSIIANENACLAVIKQEKMVSCLAQLSNVLCMGLNVSSKGDTFAIPHTVATAKASQQAKSSAATTTPATTSTISKPGGTTVAPSTLCLEGAPTGG
jgi:hypothetical protein